MSVSSYLLSSKFLSFLSSLTVDRWNSVMMMVMKAAPTARIATRPLVMRKVRTPVMRRCYGYTVLIYSETMKRDRPSPSQAARAEVIVWMRKMKNAYGFVGCTGCPS